MGANRVSFDAITVVASHEFLFLFLCPYLPAPNSDVLPYRQEGEPQQGHAPSSPALIAYMPDFLTFLICRRQQDAKGWNLECHPRTGGAIVSFSLFSLWKAKTTSR